MPESPTTPTPEAKPERASKPVRGRKNNAPDADGIHELVKLRLAVLREARDEYRRLAVALDALDRAVPPEA